MNRKHLLAALVTLTLSAAGQAATIFADNFDANSYALNGEPAGWTVGSGTVDIIGVGSPFDFLPGNGSYIDLDGTTGQSGLLTKSFSLTAGVQYTATFDLAGSHRNSTETGTVLFGGSSLNYDIASATGFTSHSLVFTPGASGSYALSFQNHGGDNIGALLDNVKITSAVPEPQTYALMLGGLAAVAFGARRRQA